MFNAVQVDSPQAPALPALPEPNHIGHSETLFAVLGAGVRHGTALTRPAMCSLWTRYGRNWRENSDEHASSVRRGGSFLAGRGYDNPEIAAVKFGLADDIQRAVARLGTPIQAKVAVCAVRRALVARGLHHGRRAQGAGAFKLKEVSNRRSTGVLAAWVRDAHLFKVHARQGFL